MSLRPSSPAYLRLQELTECARAAYVTAELPRAPDKGGDNLEHFCVIGTDVDGLSGRVGTALTKCPVCKAL